MLMTRLAFQLARWYRYQARAYAIIKAIDSTTKHAERAPAFCIFECDPLLRKALKAQMAEEFFVQLQFEKLHGADVVVYAPRVLDFTRSAQHGFNSR